MQLATLGAFLLLPLLDSRAATPLVLLANKGVYNISTFPNKQLVHELNLRIANLVVLHLFP
jgi:hypothetical protein